MTAHPTTTTLRSKKTKTKQNKKYKSLSLWILLFFHTQNPSMQWHHTPYLTDRLVTWLPLDKDNAIHQLLPFIWFSSCFLLHLQKSNSVLDDICFFILNPEMKQSKEPVMK